MLPSATTTFGMLQATSKSHQATPLQSTTTVVKLKSNMPTETRNHEAEIAPPASSQAGGTAAPLPLFAGAPPASSQAGVAP